MADREFVFSHPEVQKLLRDRFVPLAMDDWYLRRQQDEHGRFFREMTRESPRGNAGDNTRQGRYVFTATGKFLGFNNNRGPDRILAMLRDALAKWERLPEAERRPAAPTGDVKLQPQYDRTPPKGGAVVKVYTRVLERAADGTLTACPSPPREEGNFQHRGLAAAVDHLWLTPSDIQSLLPDKNAVPGAALPLPRALAQRIARFHLTDSTRGEPPHWRRDEVKALTLTLTPESENRARLSGNFHLETSDGRRGCSGRMDGWLEYRDGKLSGFQAAATGEHWGDGPFTRGSRPGRSPIGFAFVLCPDPQPADAIPPQAARWLEGYFDPDRN